MATILIFVPFCSWIRPSGDTDVDVQCTVEMFVPDRKPLILLSSGNS